VVHDGLLVLRNQLTLRTAAITRLCGNGKSTDCRLKCGSASDDRRFGKIRCSDATSISFGEYFEYFYPTEIGSFAVAWKHGKRKLADD
jgi:hypothetical protein